MLLKVNGVREQGFLTKIMDKEIMLDFAVKAGLNVPYSVTVESTSGGEFTLSVYCKTLN